MAGMCVRSARKWQDGPLPSETKEECWWRTRSDPFDGVWEEEIEPLLRGDSSGKLKATTIIEWLEEQHSGRFSASQLRTLQRRLADARTAITFSLSPRQAHDAPEGRKLLARLGPQRPGAYLLMDRAYEGNETRQLALDLGFVPVVPSLSTRVAPWVYDREMYKRRNEIERLFGRLKGFRRIFSRFEKLDVIFLGGVVKRVCSRSSLPGVGRWPGKTRLSWHNGSPRRATA